MARHDDEYAFEKYFAPEVQKTWAERFGWCCADCDRRMPADVGPVVCEACLGVDVVWSVPAVPLPARQYPDNAGRRRYEFPRWPTGPLFDWLLADGISPYRLRDDYGIQVKWSRPYLPHETVERICHARRVHPFVVYGWDRWATLADWELDVLDRFDAEQQAMAAA